MTERALAVCLIVGDELLAGAHPDLNGPFLARHLGELGIGVFRIEVLDDDEAIIEAAVRRARNEVGLVFVCGGLGPTLDDVTRHGVARAFDDELVESQAVTDDLRARFTALVRDFPDANRRQALFPSRSTIVPNAAGTAPGFRLTEGGTTTFVLPGPPRELAVVWHEEVAPWIEREVAGVRRLETYRMALFGISESAFAEEIADRMDRGADPLIGCSAKEGTLYLTLRSSASDAGARLAETAEFLRARFEGHLLTEGFSGERLPRVEDVLGRELIESGTTVAFAESCTAGGAVARLASVPGISAVLGRSFVTYSNEAKVELVGVPEATLESHGAVSAETVGAMALGVARAAGTRLGIATSGIAGPGGARPGKPVGTIHVGVALDGSVSTAFRNYPASWGRGRLQTVAARFALHRALVEMRNQQDPTSTGR